MRRTTLALLLLVLFLPSPASAALVRASTTFDRGPDTVIVTVEAAPGERNDVTVTRDAGGTWTVRDAGAPLTAAAGCVAVDAGTTTCATPPLARLRVLRVDAGDGDDAVTATGDLHAELQGGDGDDLLRAGGLLAGGPGADRLEGGPRGDVLAGGPGADALVGGDGDDRLLGDLEPGLVTGRYVDLGGADDLLDGGSGRDAAEYTRRTSPVVVDLADPAPDGAEGERDVLLGIEAVGGGGGADVLTGDDADNELVGGAGDDRIAGRGGADDLGGDAGADRLDGGDGDDRLLPAEGITLRRIVFPDGSLFLPRTSPGDPGDVALGGPGADTLAGSGQGVLLDGGPGDDRVVLVPSAVAIACGEGRDSVRGDLLGRRLDGCELAVLDVFDDAAVGVSPSRNVRGRLGLPVHCRDGPRGMVARCDVTVEVRLRRGGAPPVLLGRARASVPGGRRGTARIRVGARGRRALARAARPLLQLTVEGTFASRWRVRPPGGGIRIRRRLSGSWTVRLGP